MESSAAVGSLKRNSIRRVLELIKHIRIVPIIHAIIFIPMHFKVSDALLVLPLQHHYFEITPVSGSPRLFPSRSLLSVILFLSLCTLSIAFLHRACYFEITLYLSSHFSFLSVAYRKIGQEVQAAGEL
jgi:hypothetical protein